MREKTPRKWLFCGICSLQPREAAEGAGAEAEAEAVAEAEVDEPVSEASAEASERDSESASGDESESVKSGEEDNAAAEPLEVEVKEEEVCGS